MAINQYQRPKSSIDAIADAVGVARNIYGIHADSQAIENAKKLASLREEEAGREREKFAMLKGEQERKQKGELTTSEFLAQADKYSPAKPGEKGAITIPVRQGEGLVEYVVKPRFGGDQNGLDNQIKMLTLQEKQLALSDKKRGVSDGQRLPPDKVLSVNQGNNIPRQLVDIKQTLDENQDAFGPIKGRLSSINPYDERAQTIDAQMRASAQEFGRYMEGGVLRKEDEEKYRKMFPSLSDTPELAANKLSIVDKLLKERQASDIKALEGSGYNTSALASVDSGQAPVVPRSIRPKSRGQDLIPEAKANSAETRVIDGAVYKRINGGWQKI